MLRWMLLAALCLTGCAAAPLHTATPRASYHQHLLSPAVARLWSTPTREKPSQRLLQPLTADGLVTQLDAAGIRRALVLSVAYTYGDPRREVADEAALVRAENDWTVAQAARHPGRLVAFCGVSPLRDYALDEIARCARELHVPGIKLHLGNSGVDLRDAAHRARLRAVFAAAEAHHLAVVVHVKTRRPDYGAEDALAFVDDVLPAAPTVPVQIAHLGGSGPGYPAFADAAMGVFVDALKAGKLHNVYFDVTTVVTPGTDTATAALIARRIREVGARRVRFGADLAVGGNPAPREAWTLLREKLPLTDAEFATIARNDAAYFR